MRDLFAEKIIAQFFENVNSSKKKRKRIFKKQKFPMLCGWDRRKIKKWLNLKNEKNQNGYFRVFLR